MVDPELFWVGASYVRLTEGQEIGPQHSDGDLDDVGEDRCCDDAIDEQCHKPEIVNT